MKFLPVPKKIATTDASVGRGIAYGFEMAGVIVIFALLGLGMDVWLGTKPLFVLVMTLLGVVGLLARSWYGFSEQLDKLEAQRRAPVAQPSPAKVDEYS